MKRFCYACLAVFLIVLALEYFIHGVILKDLYARTMYLWRTDGEIQELAWLMWLGYAIFSAVFVVIYAKGCEPKKPALGQGIRYGAWIGLLMGSTASLVVYAVMPIPAMMSVWWFVGTMVECIVAGAVASLIYQPRQS